MRRSNRKGCRKWGSQTVLHAENVLAVAELARTEDIVSRASSVANRGNAGADRNSICCRCCRADSRSGHRGLRSAEGRSC